MMQSGTFFMTVLCGDAAGLLTPPPAAQADALTRRAASPGSLTRRALLPAGLAAAAWPSWASAAPAALELETRTSKAYSVSYGTPPAWPLSEQELSDSRYLYVATDPNEPDSANVVLTIQPLRADYSALGSFGTIGLVGASLMPQCITGGGGSGPANGMCTMDADGIEGKMLASEVVNCAYAYDYTIEQKGQPKRHLRTLFAVQTEEGRGLRQ